MSGQQYGKDSYPPLKVILGLFMGQINARESDVPPRDRQLFARISQVWPAFS